MDFFAWATARVSRDVVGSISRALLYSRSSRVNTNAPKIKPVIMALRERPSAKKPPYFNNYLQFFGVVLAYNIPEIGDHSNTRDTYILDLKKGLRNDLPRTAFERKKPARHVQSH